MLAIERQRERDLTYKETEMGRSVSSFCIPTFLSFASQAIPTAPSQYTMHSTLGLSLFTLFLASFSSARIMGITAPATVTEGTSLSVTVQVDQGHISSIFRIRTLTHFADLQTQSYISDNIDYSIIFGFVNADFPCNNCIGTPAGSFDLVYVPHTRPDRCPADLYSIDVYQIVLKDTLTPPVGRSPKRSTLRRLQVPTTSPQPSRLLSE